jgi:hypothetical protein
MSENTSSGIGSKVLISETSVLIILQAELLKENHMSGYDHILKLSFSHPTGTLDKKHEYIN